MIITGKVKEILTLENGVSKAGKDWQRRTLVIDTGDKYQPLLAITFIKVDLLYGLKKGRYFTQANGYKIS